MGRPDRRRTRTGRGAAARWARPLAGLLILIATPYLGCSVEKHYRVLSFFFDGVPDPTEAIGADAAAPRRNASVVWVIHEPYETDSCGSCHQDPATSFSAVPSGRDSASCLQCHPQVTTASPFIHGPVAVNACLWCHNPHLSPNPHLLRKRSPEICLECHGGGFMAMAGGAHEDPNADCLHCHSGHGGATHALLRSDYEPTSPQSETGHDPAEGTP